MQYFNLQDRVALITGASSGLGAHFAKTLARAGAIVGIAARRLERLDALAREIEASGGTAVPIEMDVTERGSIQSGLDHLAKAASTPSILINNAGIARSGSFLDASDEDTRQLFDTNQQAVWDAAQLMARALVAADLPGSIINISSILGLATGSGVASYATSKGAVAHMTKLMALELAPHNIRVNAIAPGYFRSEMTDDYLKSEHGQKILQRVPMKRHGEHGELDGLLLLLASDRGSFMTGTVTPVDGGHLISSL